MLVTTVASFTATSEHIEMRWNGEITVGDGDDIRHPTDREAWDVEKTLL